MKTRFVLKNALRQEIDGEVDRIREAARREGEDLLEDARAQGQSRQREAVARFEREMDLRRRRALSKARLEGRNSLLEVKRRAIDRVFDEAPRALATLAAQQPDRYGELLVALFQTARRVLPAGPLRLRAGKEEAKRLRPALKDEEVKIVTEERLRGLILETPDGRVRCDDSFDILLRWIRAEREAELEAILFEEDYEAGHG